MGLYDYTIHYKQSFSYQESKTSSYFKSLYILCMRSGGTDGKSRHQYHLQFNTIACCSQAALHSLIMSGWHCWSHVAAGVWEFNHGAAIKFSLPYGLNPYSLVCPDHLLPYLREAGGGRRTSMLTGQQIAAPPRSLGDTSCPWICIGHTTPNTSSPQT